MRGERVPIRGLRRIEGLPERGEPAGPNERDVFGHEPPVHRPTQSSHASIRQTDARVRESYRTQAEPSVVSATGEGIDGAKNPWLSGFLSARK